MKKFAAFYLLACLLLLALALTDCSSDAPTASGTDTGDVTVSDTETETLSETETESGTTPTEDSATETPAVSENESETETDAEDVSETEGPPETDPQTIPTTEPVTEPATAPETDGETEPETEQPNTTPYPIDHLTFFGHEVGEVTVVYADDASVNIQNAAIELCNYIEKACGTRPAIKKASESTGTTEILIGATDRDTASVIEARNSLGYDGYLIHGEGGKLFLCGDSERSTFYAVYGLLEDYLGCRFYTTFYERIIEQHEVDIAADIHEAVTPRFFYRESGYGDRSRDATFATKLRLNGCQWTLTGGGATDNRAYYAGDFVHTLWKLCGEESNVIGWAPCLSDETVYETVLENVRKTLAASPDATFISVSLNDCYDYQRGCQCETCTAFNTEYKSDGATMMAFVNRIAREIKDEYPNVMVDTLAYMYTQTAPVGIVMEDNVVVRFCPIQACTCHSYEECTEPTTVKFKEDLADWEKICDNLFVWYYSENTANFHVPYPNILPMREHFNHLANSAVQGFYFEGYGDAPNTDLMYLRIYMGAKLLWDPDMTEEEYDIILNDFLEGYYGAGWQYIREYMDRLDASLSDSRHMRCGIAPNMYLRFNKKSEMQEFLDLWQAALEAAETEEHRAHVERDSISWMYYYLHRFGCENNPELTRYMVSLMRKYDATRVGYGADVLADPNFDPTTNSLWMKTWA